MKNIISSVRGTRDFYPNEKAKHNWLYSKFKQVSQAFGYQEYEVPYIEKLELYAAKSGEELVKQQAFVFQDKSGEDIALRPELTPSLARMIAQRQNELMFPLRWWAFGPIWRYEKPGKGRSREFFQWNIDMIGAESAEADAELVAICASFFQSVGLKPGQVVISINDRKLTTKLLTKFGVEEKLLDQALKLIDKFDKLPFEDWVGYGGEIGLSKKTIQLLKESLVVKEGWKESPELVKFFNALKNLGVSDYVRFDPKIVRGLDYYTGIVFEAYDVEGGRAIMGGGRYDNLVADVGGAPLPGVGFAMGDVMLSVVLEKYGLMPDFEPYKNAILMTLFDEASVGSSLEFAKDLRKQGIDVITYPGLEKLQKQLKYADRIKIRYVIIIGPDEIQNHQVVIKQLDSHEQLIINKDEAVGEIIKLLAK